MTSVAPTTLSDAWWAFSETMRQDPHTGWSPGEYRAADRYMHRFTQSVGMTIPLGDITPTVIRAFLGGPRVHVPSAVAALELFHAFFGWCVERGHLRTSPVPPAAEWQVTGRHHPVIGHRAFIAARRKAWAPEILANAKRHLGEE